MEEKEEDFLVQLSNKLIEDKNSQLIKVKENLELKKEEAKLI